MASVSQKKNPWGMKVGGSGGDFEYHLCPEGTYPATIVGMYDVGNQTAKAKDGTTYESRKLVMIFELSEKRPDGKPFVMGERYTMSMSETSNLFKLAKNVAGASIRKDEEFNPLILMGMPVMLSVTNTSVGEKTYHNVGTVSGFPKGFPKPAEPETELVAWSVNTDDPFPESADSLPFIYGKSIRKLAEESAEWRDRNNIARVGYQPTKEESDKIPF